LSESGNAELADVPDVFVTLTLTMGVLPGRPLKIAFVPRSHK